MVRGIASHGASCASLLVAQLMTPRVVSCSPGDTIHSVMSLMTAQRIRHMPVLREGEIVGIISIGDIVKHRIGEIETESHALRQYIASG